MRRMKNTIAAALLSELKTRKADTPALVQQKEGKKQYRELSWKEFCEKSLSLSHYLKKQGVGPQDKILICSENCPEWGMAFLAILNLGAIVVPSPFSSTGKEIKNLIEKTQAKFLFLSENTKKTLLKEESNIPAHFAWDIEKNNPLEELITGIEPMDIDPNHCSPDDIAVLIFTSGTTGKSKSVPLTHKNILTNVRDVTAMLDISHKDTSVSILPLSHMLELTGGFLSTCFCSVQIVYTKSLRTEDILNAMQDFKCSVFLTVPLVLELIAKGIEQQLNSLPSPIKNIFSLMIKLSKKKPSMGKVLLYPIHKKFGGRLRFFVSGGAKLQPWVYNFFTDIGIPVLQGYGLTETSPVIAITSLEKKSAQSVGIPLKGVEVSIMDENNNISSGEGEICVRGESVFSGYLQAEHNKEAFLDNWFRTGDLGKIHPDGSLEVTGRKKDIIVTAGGKNVYPEEIEAQLTQTGKFLEVCVLGMTSDLGHEQVTAVLRLNTVEWDKKPGLREVKSFVLSACQNMSDYMKPQMVHIMEEEFPKTHTKKIKRHEVKKIIEEGRVTKSSERKDGNKIDMGDKLEKTIGEAIEALTKKQASDLDKSETLLNLGLDSLTLVEIIGTAEKKFSFEIDSIELGQLETLNDLIEEIRKLSTSKVKKKGPVLFSQFHPTDGLKLRWFIPRMMIAITLRLIMKLFNRISAGGSQSYQKEKGALIFTPNHKSHLDTVAIVSTINYTRQRKTFAVAAKDYFFENPFKALFARIFINAIPFDRKKQVKEGIQKCATILEEGGSLVIFPEGHRVQEKEMDVFKPGVGYLLAGNGKVKAVPVYISGSNKAFPYGSCILKPAKVRVFYGEPISFESFTGEDGIKRIAQKLKEEVQKLKDKYE